MPCERTVARTRAQVIDECAQSVEAACWIALQLGRRAVLAGDHRQLPPTVQSQVAMERGLGVTLFDRLAAMHGERVMRMLTLQYRMHADIMRWSSHEFYGASPCVCARMTRVCLCPGGKRARAGLRLLTQLCMHGCLRLPTLVNACTCVCP